MKKGKYLSLLVFSLSLLFIVLFTPNTGAEMITNINYNEIRREIVVKEMGSVHLSDSYYFTSKVNNLKNIKIYLPGEAYNFYACDTLGRLPIVSEEKDETYMNATITYRISLKEGEAGKFTVAYQLPWESFIEQYSSYDFNFSFTFFEHFNWIIEKLTVSIKLPEGAKFISSSTQIPLESEIQKNTFQETVIFTLNNVTSYDALDLTVNYKYEIFWSSFHPMLWMGILGSILSTVFLLRRGREFPSPPLVTVPYEGFLKFAETYEEKMRILLELESIEQRARSRRISRRRYRVQRKTLEGRISSLSRDITDLREEIRKAGPRFADLMEKIELAETELEGVKEDIRRIEARYRRRELSSEAYRKLLEEYRRRREKAETMLDGLIIRLQEEIR